MHEYGWTLDYVLGRVSMARGFALYAAIAARYEVDLGGPSYSERQILEALRGARPACGAAA